MIFVLWGVIDIGSNTLRLAVYQLEGGQLQPMLNKKYPAGLAGYVEEDGRMNAAGIRRTVEILQSLKRLAVHIGLTELFPFATASLRNISNTEEVLDVIRKECGLQIRVLSGQEEALFDYYGAVRSVNLDRGLLVDVGGGSTELVFFRDSETVVAESIPVGSLNLFQKFISGLLPEKKELKKIRREIMGRLDQIPMLESLSFDVVCGVGGSARGAQNLINALNGWPEDTNRYACGRLKEVTDLLESDPKRLIRQILKIAPERIHTLLPGIAVLRAVTDCYGAHTVLTSRYGVREGYLCHVLEERGIWNGRC